MNSDTQKPHERNSPSQQLDASQFNHLQDHNNPSLSIELPSPVQESNTNFNNDNEPTTPTSPDHRIPVATTCPPPAPRKPRSVPMCGKRRTPSFRRIVVDLMERISEMSVPPEIVFDRDVLAGDLGAGDRAKRVKS